MITRIEAQGFRSLRHVAQSVASFQVLVGANGTGKSTFLDVVAFLGDLLKVGPLRAIVGDWANNIPARAADPSHLGWMREKDRFQLAIELAIPGELVAKVGRGKFKRARYEVAVHVASEGGEVGLEAETLWLAPERTPAEGGEDDTRERRLFPELREPGHGIVREARKQVPGGWKKVVSKVSGSGNDYFSGETSKWQSLFRLGPTKSALANLPEDETRFAIGTWVKRFLMEGINRVVLNAEAMRAPSPPGTPQPFLPDGSNLAWVIQGLRRGKDRERFDRWLEHVRTALPDLKNLRTVERQEDRHRYLVLEYENGLKVPSWGISDGTLRLLALTLIAYIPQRDRVYLIEEPENGIHPRAVETVYQSLCSVYDAQVLLASHSPIILGMAQPRDLLCFAKDQRGATDIVRGTDHPRLRDWKGTLDLGTLFAAGVLG